jgi:hypothetical protein
MDVDTLLTRQMELHTSVRHPPKNPQGLVQLMDIMRNYKNYFESLRNIAERFNVEPETVFQAFMYISVGGTVNFDRQHQDGSVPMHQAKVLARSNAIELSSTLRKELPNAELMVYVGLSRDLRATLRVKVEDGNDLKTAEASVREAVEYLNYIDHCAHHNPEKLFAFYMAEDPASLAALLNDSDPLTMTQSMSGSAMRGSGTALPAVFDEGGTDVREPTPLPTPLSSFLQELKKQCGLASDTSSASGGATRRLKAAQVMLDWVTAVPVEYFAEHAERIVAVVATTLSLLATEKRSALCRVGCEVITILLQRLSPEPVFVDDVDRGTCSANPETFSGALQHWTASLAKGTYVTVAAISTAADAALRTVAVQSHGHICVVKKLLEVLAAGTQTELRRKCLGYLALCVAAAHTHNPESVRELIRLLAPVAVDYVSIGDSPSRKMARALCSVLRVLAPNASPTCRDALVIADERVEHLVQQERPQVEPAVLGGPQDLEELLFEADAFVSSTRSSFSNSASRHSGAAVAVAVGGTAGHSSGGGARGRGGVGGGGRGAGKGLRRADLPSHGISSSSGGGEGVASCGRTSGQAPLATRTPAGSGAAAAKRGIGESTHVPSPVRRQTGTASDAKAGRMLGDVRSPTRRAAPSAAVPVAGGGGGGCQKWGHDGQRRHTASPANGATEEGIPTSLRRSDAEAVVSAENGVYDTDSFLGSDNVPKKNAKAEEHHEHLASASHPLSHGCATRSSDTVLPLLGVQIPREVMAEGHLSGTGNARAGLLRNNGSHHSATPFEADRPVPLSLRERSGERDDEATPAMMTEPTATVRISRSLRRKIEENKPS